MAVELLVFFQMRAQAVLAHYLDLLSVRVVFRRCSWDTVMLAYTRVLLIAVQLVLCLGLHGLSAEGNRRRL